MTCGIYCIVNKEILDLYIGQSRDLRRRQSQHFCLLAKNKHYNLHLQRACDKYSIDNFEFRILLICEPEDLTYYEQYLVDKWKPVYNTLVICVTTRAGMPVSEETKQKIRLASKGRTVSPETKLKLSLANKGRIVSKETRLKLSIALLNSTNPGHTGYHHTKETKQKLREARALQPTPNIGIKISDMWKQNISKAKKGKPIKKHSVPMSVEHKEKDRQAHLGKITSEETKQKLRELAQTPEAKARWAKLLENKKGKPMTEEHKRKISAARQKFEQQKSERRGDERIGTNGN